MGRGKVQLKRIEDKSSRQVSFSKRRNGLMKKAYELSVLCDIDVALFVFSGKNRLYEFSTGESGMTRILTRYKNHKEADEAVHKKLALQNGDVSTADEITQLIQRNLEERKLKASNATELTHLEEDIGIILQQIRTRKTQLLLGVMKDLQEKQKQLTKEKQFMAREIMATKMNNNVDG